MTERARWAGVALSVILLIGANIQISVWLIHRSQQQLCGVIAVSVEPDPSTPPTTPRGVRAAQEMSKLYRQYDC
jgi:hypothetical protein